MYHFFPQILVNSYFIISKNFTQSFYKHILNYYVPDTWYRTELDKTGDYILRGMCECLRKLILHYPNSFSIFYYILVYSVVSKLYPVSNRLTLALVSSPMSFPLSEVSLLNTHLNFAEASWLRSILAWSGKPSLATSAVWISCAWHNLLLHHVI